MAEEIVPPFSARNRGAHKQIDNDFPKTAKIGLLHILYDLVDSRFVSGWQEVTAELQRIARIRPGPGDKTQAKSHVLAEAGLELLPWEKVFDFCERLYSHLAREVVDQSGFDRIEVLTPLSGVQEYIAKELQRLFLEENLPFEFSNGVVRRRGRRHTADQVSRAELVLGDPRLSSALMHFNKALKYFRTVAQPDYENTVKEAVCAVEAAARALFPDKGSTLGAIVNSITGDDPGQLPKTIAKTFHGLYGFSGSGVGVRHGGTSGGSVTKELAEYALALSASQIVLLVDVAAALETPVPF
jgi:hypothetical protein